jgi:hypothetical protein
MMRLLTLITLLVGLSACQTNTGGEAGPVDSNAIQWDRNPATVVFRADVVGGSSAGTFMARNEIPLCTVYGDNHVVWLNQLSASETQVLYDQLTDETIRNFVTYLTFNEQFFDYEAGADVQPAGSVRPVVETLTLFVSGEMRQSDAYSGWKDGDYFNRVLTECSRISTAPVIYEPTAAWVSAQVIPADQPDSGAFNISWDGAANGLSLAELAAGDRRWITDRNVRVLWNLIRNSPANLRFTEGDVQYFVAMEVPNVTRDAPQPPASS